MNTEERTINTEQRTNLKFLVRLGKTPSQALEMLKQVYGDNTMSRTRVFEWHKRFKKGLRKWKMIPGVGGIQRAGLR